MRHIALATILTTGCLPFDVPQRPSYDAACRPSDSTFVEMAASRRDLYPISKISADPELALGEALAEVKRRGLTLRKKKTTETILDGFSTTLPGVILLEPDWDEKPMRDRAWKMWHEIVHAEQYDRMAPQRFLAWYAVPEGRWSLEVPAYTQTFALQLHFGEPPENVIANIEHVARMMRTRYLLTEMPACTVDLTEELLIDGVGLR